jgi:hypothetical protein
MYLQQYIKDHEYGLLNTFTLLVDYNHIIFNGSRLCTLRNQSLKITTLAKNKTS